MGERHDLPKIKPDQQPTIFNAEAGNMGFAGTAIASLIGGVRLGSRGTTRDAIRDFKSSTEIEAIAAKELGFMKKLSLAIVGAGALGALVGGLIDKSKQEKEQVEGRTVKTPGYLNIGIFGGLFAGAMLQYGYIASALSLKNIDTKAVQSYISSLKENRPSGGKYYMFALAPVVFATLGSIMRKNSLQRDFDKAVAIRDAHTAQAQQMLAASIAQQQVPAAPTMDEPQSFKNSVTPDEAALLMEKQAQATPPLVEKPAHGPEHKPQPDHAAHGDAHAPEHHAAHGEHHSEHPSHAAKHEQHQHTGSHAAKHEPAASHTDHAQKHDAGMAMSA